MTRRVAPEFDLVIPTTGRPQLRALLDDLTAGAGPTPARLFVVDDRRVGAPRVDLLDGVSPPGVTVLRSGGRGPAAARNTGWRAGDAEWVAFLDDDVRLPSDWRMRLADDLASVGPRVGGSQGRIVVPLRDGRRPTDWERNVHGLETARWATADMAYRRRALTATHGFDERFPRAYREDADLAARVRQAGFGLAVGTRHVVHPVRPAGRWTSVAKQAGNADDALLRLRYGRRWRAELGTPPGRFGRHVATTVAGAVAVVAAARRRRRMAVIAAGTATALLAEFTVARVRPGPHDRREVATMIATSAAIPPVAVAYRVGGFVGAVNAARRGLGPAATVITNGGAPVGAVLFDRDGTLIVDVPYNGDPARVHPVPGARAALDRLRDAGVRVAMISNQSGIARGLLTVDDVRAVNARVDELLGPFELMLFCPHGEDDGCACRKPAAGMVHEAATRLGVAPTACAVIGDTAADVAAALRAGSRAVLVPNDRTRREEIWAAPVVARDVAHAVDEVLTS